MNAIRKVRIDLTGQRFGMLVVQSLHSVANGKAKWNCLCDCGKTSAPFGQGLRSGNTSSCGCMITVRRVEATKKHGHFNSRTYRAWQNMKRRCTKADCKEYKNYGGRGITFPDEWHDFVAFLRDMGECPEGMELERNDNDLSYSKENCCWTTRIKQIRNRRMTLKFEGVPLAEIADKTGINYDTLYTRLKRHGTPFPAVIRKHKVSEPKVTA